MSNSEDVPRSQRERAIAFLLDLRDDKRLATAALNLPKRMTAGQAQLYERARQLAATLTQYAAELNGLSDENLFAREQVERQALETKRLAAEAKFSFNQPQSLADVSYWCVWPDWSIEEGIALVLDRDPRVVMWEDVKSCVSVSALAKQFGDLLKLADRARIAGQLRARNHPGVFLRWVERTKQVNIPKRLRAAVETNGVVVADWQDVADKQAKELERCTSLIDRLTETLNTQRAQLKTLLAERDLLVEQVIDHDHGPWPWGEHETPLLVHLAAAAERFWKLYDANDPSTAPTNEQVTTWLVSRAVPQRVAQVFAQALRAPDIPPGPRK